MNPGTATDIFYASQGNDPLFAPVDGANCPDVGAAAQTIDDKAAASSQLLTKGNIRVFIPVPANAEYQVSVLSDPYGCENSADYGLPSGMLSMYRRVLNATNLTRNAQFGSNPTSISAQGTIMWDGREPSLQSQFIDATLGHAQAGAPPTDDQVKQGVNFEIGLFTTQNFDNQAGRLSAAGATGGPVNLSRIGIQRLVDVLVSSERGEDDTVASPTAGCRDQRNATTPDWRYVSGRQNVHHHRRCRLQRRRSWESGAELYLLDLP